jgi:hypothetical protein
MQSVVLVSRFPYVNLFERLVKVSLLCTKRSTAVHNYYYLLSLVLPLHCYHAFVYALKS